MKIITATLVGYMAASSSAEIFQWHDGDGDGSYWLSDSVVEPYVDLSRQLLWWADLPFANLHHANLLFTNLSFANLENANLSSADLSYANLYEANLTESDLAFTIFTGADLEASNIEDANLFYADVSDANLTNLENWDSAFWLAARYNANTIFPEGMNPDDYAMIELVVPTPTTGCVLFGMLFLTRRRT